MLSAAAITPGPRMKGRRSGAPHFEKIFSAVP